MKKLLSVAVVLAFISSLTSCACGPNGRFGSNAYGLNGYYPGQYQGNHRAVVTPYGTVREHISPAAATQQLQQTISLGLGGTGSNGTTF